MAHLYCLFLFWVHSHHTPNCLFLCWIGEGQFFYSIALSSFRDPALKKGILKKWDTEICEKVSIYKKQFA